MKIDYRGTGYYSWIDAKITEGGTTLEYSLGINDEVPGEIITLLEGVSDLYRFSNLSEEEMFNLLKEYVLEDIQYLGE